MIAGDNLAIDLSGIRGVSLPLPSPTLLPSGIEGICDSATEAALYVRFDGLVPVSGMVVAHLVDYSESSSMIWKWKFLVCRIS